MWDFAIAVAGDDVGCKARHGFHLAGGKVGIAAGVAGILDLDPYGRGVDIGLAAPEGNARMPGAEILGHI